MSAGGHFTSVSFKFLIKFPEAFFGTKIASEWGAMILNGSSDIIENDLIPYFRIIGGEGLRISVGT
jgi:hypothetical protein